MLPRHWFGRLSPVALLLIAFQACSTASPPTSTEEVPHVVPPGEPLPPPTSTPTHAPVKITLDGAPIAGAVVLQGGNARLATTDDTGKALVELDAHIGGAPTLIASHPDARQSALVLHNYAGEEVTINLTRFTREDNPNYVFQDPGLPEEGNTTAYCNHCHVALHTDWYASPHRTSASNPLVHDLYSGTAHKASDESTCLLWGGQWRPGLQPGTGSSTWRCYLGSGALPDLNTACGQGIPCDGVSTKTGGCADCHAPGINGTLGGRDLLEAQGIAYEHGVHCDVCHKVESIDLSKEPGTAGALHIVRPSEPSSSPAFGAWWPLTFAPRHDVPNPRMGSVQRDHFTNGALCGGCHQSRQASLIPGASVDRARWPDGTIPIHTTYQEWKEGPLGDKVPCNNCHMPPNPALDNSSGFEELGLEEGITAGWKRPRGTVRHHTFIGPRTPKSRMLELAAAIFISKEVQGDELSARVTVRNVGPGHSIPTGEPMRSILLHVRATCDGVALPSTGGDVIPDFGGNVARKERGADWSRWPNATVGNVVRVVRQEGDWHDYQGFGPFGEGGRFSPAEKGMPVESFVGQSTITALDGDTVTFDAPLPEGDLAYLGEVPADTGEAARAIAGAPGFGFARVLSDASGQRMVPHFLATNVVSDNRLLPQSSWTSTHRFHTTCGSEAQVTGTLLYRAYPLALARERRWELKEHVMTETTR